VSRKITLIAVALAAALFGGHAGAQEKSATDDRCAQCHQEVVEARRATPDVHFELVCADCHAGRENPHETPVLTESRQEIVDRVGELDGMPPSTVGACFRCHEDEVVQWLTSVHGPEANIEQKGLAPDCLTCHGPGHAMKPAPETKAEVFAHCAGCHAFSGEEDRPETNPFVVDTYRDTIHGRLLRMGNEDAAACGDCHGVHDVLAPTDPKSSVHPDNVANTCAECHAGATASFSRAVSHKPPLVDHNLWGWLVSVFFSALTFGTIGLLLVHLGLDMFRAVRGGNHHPPQAAKAPLHRDDEVQRFDIHARIQHWGMMVSFTTLVLTGWPLKAAAVGQSSTLMRLMGGPAMVGLIHRIAGGILLAVAIYHVIYLVVGIRNRSIKLSMIPALRDIRDFSGNIAYMLGLRKDRPAFARFTYYEKFDYWAVFWGMLIMGLSGVMLWFPVQFAWFLPGEFIELGRIAHSDEALLAAMAIFLWHFYNVHLRPSIFPMSWVWLTGRISAEALYHEHRGEYEARYGSTPPADLGKPRPWHRHAAWAIVGLLSVTGAAIGVALADMQALRESIDELISPPPPPAVEPRPELANAPPRTSRPEDPFSDCTSCHDKQLVDEGQRFPHFDHFDDYFDGEIDDPQCTLCHESTWHKTTPVKREVCTDCHSDKEVDRYSKRPRLAADDEDDEEEEEEEEEGEEAEEDSDEETDAADPAEAPAAADPASAEPAADEPAAEETE
jgi:cytochrome b subunit of formate dehydrogenase